MDVSNNQVCSDMNDGTGISLQVGDATGAALLMPAVDDGCITGDFVEIAGELDRVSSAFNIVSSINMHFLSPGSRTQCNTLPNLAVDNK